MKSRLEPAKANTATAHKLACILYRMLRYGKEYVDPGMQYYEEKYRN
jgi:transposase